MVENWYAVFVKTGDEEEVKKRIALLFGDELKVFNPKRELLERKMGKVKKIERVLFPGYIYISGCLSLQHINKMKRVHNVYSLLLEDVEPAVIPMAEIMVFKHLMMEDIIGISDAYMENDSVIIIDGPLLSLRGRIIKIDKRKGRAKVAIDLLGEERIIDLGINIIEKDI